MSEDSVQFRVMEVADVEGLGELELQPRGTLVQFEGEAVQELQKFVQTFILLDALYLVDIDLEALIISESLFW